MGQAKCGGWESEEWMSLSIVAFYVVGSSSFYIDINHGWCAKFCWRYHRSQCGSFNVIQFDLISECICAFMRYQLAQNEKEKQHRRSSALFRLFIACVCVSYAWIDIHSHRKYCDGHPISFETNVNRLYWNAQHNASDAIRREKPEEIQSP